MQELSLKSEGGRNFRRERICYCRALYLPKASTFTFIGLNCFVVWHSSAHHKHLRDQLIMCMDNKLVIACALVRASSEPLLASSARTVSMKC